MARVEFGSLTRIGLPVAAAAKVDAHTRISTAGIKRNRSEEVMERIGESQKVEGEIYYRVAAIRIVGKV